MEDRVPRPDIHAERRSDGGSKNEAQHHPAEQDQGVSRWRSWLDSGARHRRIMFHLGPGQMAARDPAFQWRSEWITPAVHPACDAGHQPGTAKRGIVRSEAGTDLTRRTLFLTVVCLPRTSWVLARRGLGPRTRRKRSF